MTQAYLSDSSLKDLNINNKIPIAYEQFNGTFQAPENVNFNSSNSTVEQTRVIEQYIEVPPPQKYIKIWIPETIRVKHFRNQDFSKVIEEWYKIGIYIDESGEVVDETFISNLIRLINENRIGSIFDSIQVTINGKIDFEEFRRRVNMQTSMGDMGVPLHQKYVKIWIPSTIKKKYFAGQDFYEVIQRWQKLGVYIDRSGELVDEIFISCLIRIIKENKIGYIFDLINITIDGKIDFQEFRRIVIRQYTDIPSQQTYTNNPPQGKYIIIWIEETIRIKYNISIEQWYRMGIYIHESGEVVDETFVSYLVRLIKLNRLRDVFDSIHVTINGRIDLEIFRKIVIEIIFREVNLHQTYNSTVEQTILRSNELVPMPQNDVITVNGFTGNWTNKDEVNNWRGPIPIDQYGVNPDINNAEMIVKKFGKTLEYEQKVQVRYLEPPPTQASEIVIKQESDKLLPPAPPIVIRLPQPPRPRTPDPIVYREAPPNKPQVMRKIIRLIGKTIREPKRRVVIEIPPQLPPKPQPIIIEKWLPYPENRFNIRYEKEPDPVIPVTRNRIIKWETPIPSIRRDFVEVGKFRMNPDEYIQKYGGTFSLANEFTQYLREFKLTPPVNDTKFILEGDVFALQYVNLEAEGLAFLRQFINVQHMSNPPQRKYIIIWIEETIRIKYNINIEQWYKMGIYIHESGVVVDETFVSYLVKLIIENRIGNVFDSVPINKDGKIDFEVFKMRVIEQYTEIIYQRKYIKIWIPETIRVKHFRNQDFSKVIEEWYKIGIYIDESGEVVDEIFISNLIRLINENRIGSIFDSIHVTLDGKISFEEFRRRVNGQTSKVYMGTPLHQKYIKIWIPETLKNKHFANRDFYEVIEEFHEMGIYVDRSEKPIDEPSLLSLLDLIKEKNLKEFFDSFDTNKDGKIDFEEFKAKMGSSVPYPRYL